MKLIFDRPGEYDGGTIRCFEYESKEKFLFDVLEHTKNIGEDVFLHYSTILFVNLILMKLKNIFIQLMSGLKKDRLVNLMV